MTQTPQLCPLGPALGTEALGIDLSKPLEEGTSAPALAAFGRRSGAPRPHALVRP